MHPHAATPLPEGGTRGDRREWRETAALTLARTRAGCAAAARAGGRRSGIGAVVGEELFRIILFAAFML